MAVGGAAGSAVAAWKMDGGKPSLVDFLNLTIAVVGAFQVWYATETRTNPNAKAAFAGVTASLVLLASDITGAGHLTNTQWVQVAVAGMTAAGVFVTPNKS